MSGKGFPWAELDGRRVASDDLLQLALVNYGHFTSAQVRGGRVRGLAAHLARLDAASQELFGISIDGALVRERMLNALADTTDASLRVVVFPSIQTQRLSVLVVVREPIELTGAAQALKSVHYVRPVPHIKHVGTFAQIHYGEMAERAGFDDALLIDASGAILETTMSNIGFAVDSGIVWPHGPALEGVTMRLLEEALPSTRRHTRVDELTRVDGAFVTNSIGIAAVKRVDHVELTVDQRLMARLAAAYAAVPWDQL